MNKKRIFQIVILIILIAWFGVYLHQHLEEFQQLKIANFFYAIPLGMLFICLLINNGLIVKYLLEPFEITLKFKEWFGLSVITSLGNYLTPFRGGAIARAVYLKKIHQFSYSHFLSTLAGIYIVIFLVYSLFGLSAMTLLNYYYGIFNALIFVFFLGLFLFLLAIIVFSPEIKKTKYSFINKCIEVINGWHLVKSNKKVLFATTLITIINVVIMVLMMLLEFKIFGVNIGLLNILFLSIISTFGSFISITPGALGIKEAIVAFTATVINLPISQVLAVSILDRAVGLAIIFILGPIFSYLLMNQKNDKI